MYTSLVSGVLIAFVFLYAFFISPSIKSRIHASHFAGRVAGVIDCLYISGVHFGCADFEMRSYVNSELKKAKQLPGNAALAEYVASNGFIYRAYSGDAVLFALICVLKYAHSNCNCALISRCEPLLEEARRQDVPVCF